ncbi:serine/threonine-protein kinase Chk1-like [Styela clava]
MTAAAVPFVDGWDFVQTLGEGAYGEVKLAINSGNDEAVAVKIIDLKKAQDAAAMDLIRKEVGIHKMLDHKHIVKCYGTRKETTHQYIFLAYASGGELFDKIEPDIGMPPSHAQSYFRQLISGVEYLHSLGVTHRDIKPENLLLDGNNILKIVDFGLATIFRHKGRERLINRCCGTPPYVAPEVLVQEPYHAEPADVWSCAIVLVAMLAGELPWDEPSDGCQEYCDWLDRKVQLSPWNKIDTIPLALLRRVLVESPEKRATIATVKKDRWFVKPLPFKRRSSSSFDNSPLAKRLLTESGSIIIAVQDRDALSVTQPEPQLNSSCNEISTVSVDNLLTHACLSQPVEMDNMLLSSQWMNTPATTQNMWQKLVKRMTRFWSSKTTEETINEITKVCKKFGHSVKQMSPGILTVSTTDRRKNSLVFKVCIIENNSSDNQRCLVDLRLSKGDGLEFKRHFMKFKKSLNAIVTKQPSIYGTEVTKEN